ncbi:trypsin-like serine peptidase [Streptomyces sp. NPDC127166]|uniref:trypsin-like serine peptidase n=1 Tax=Streptomyces sp. NPDC127166 TaxID=3345380 RepID=UPI00363BEB3D
MGRRHGWGGAVVAALVVGIAAGCGPMTAAGEGGTGSRHGRAPAEVETLVHDAAVTDRQRAQVEAYWTGTGIKALAAGDAAGEHVQPEWAEGGAVARTVGRLYVRGSDGGPSSCTATVVGTRTVVTAAHCVRSIVAGKPASAATWDGQPYFVPGYRDGRGLYGGFTVRRVRMAVEWQDEGQDVAMLEMNDARDGRSISGVTGTQRIAFAPERAALTHFFGYPYTSRVLHCQAPGQPLDGILWRIPCRMGVGSSGGPYMVDLDASGTGTVVAVNVSGDDRDSYGTALAGLARKLYRESERD